jgi:hypothetical protein
MSTSESELNLSGDDSSCSFGVPSMDLEQSADRQSAASEPDDDPTRPMAVVVTASDLIDKVAAAECLFDVAQLGFVQDPIFYQFHVHDANRVALTHIKVDADGWKVSFVASASQGWFDFIKISQDPEVIVFRRPKPIARLLWKDSSQRGGPVRDLSGLAGVKIGRLNRSANASGSAACLNWPHRISVGLIFPRLAKNQWTHDQDSIVRAALEQALNPSQQVLGTRHNNIRMSNVAELKDFGKRFRQALLEQDDEEFSKGAIVIAWTFGGKVPLKVYQETELEPGFSIPFIHALESWFHLDLLQDINMSIATTWRTNGFEPFIHSGFPANFMTGNLDAPDLTSNSTDASLSDEDQDLIGAQSVHGTDSVPDDQLGTSLSAHDSGDTDAEDDVIEDHQEEDDIPLADAALGATFSNASAEFFCR